MRTVPPIARVACSLLALAALSACNKPQPDEQEAVTAKAQQAAEQASAPAPATAPEAPPTGSCDATQVQSLVGQPMTDAAGEQARNDAWLSQHFADCDANHNEEVTKSEYEKCTGR